MESLDSPEEIFCVILFLEYTIDLEANCYLWKTNHYLLRFDIANLLRTSSEKFNKKVTSFTG